MAELKNLGAEQGSGGEWLFRQGELVLGPLPTKQLVDKLYSGELDARTEVAPVGQRSFRKIGDVDVFKLHVAKAEAKRRVEAAELVARQQAARQRNIRIALFAGVVLVAGAAAAVGARYLAIYNPLNSSDGLADIEIEPPTITVARARVDEDLVEYPVGGAPSAPRKTDRPALAEHKADKGPDKPRAVAERPHAPDKASRPAAGGGSLGALNDPDDEPDGLQTAKFDREAINAVIASHKRSLGTCFTQEAERTPDFGGKFPLEFVIGNDGRVSKLWVDHPSYKKGPLADCLLKELQKWPFKPYPGEQATIGLSFTIGKRG
jgi:hypothetical protein